MSTPIKEAKALGVSVKSVLDNPEISKSTMYNDANGGHVKRDIIADRKALTEREATEDYAFFTTDYIQTLVDLVPKVQKALEDLIVFTAQVEDPFHKVQAFRAIPSMVASLTTIVSKLEARRVYDQLKKQQSRPKSEHDLAEIARRVDEEMKSERVQRRRELLS
jgi:hypothetical protein